LNRLNFRKQKRGSTDPVTSGNLNTMQANAEAEIQDVVKNTFPVPAAVSASDLAVTPNGDWRVRVSAGSGYDEYGAHVYNAAQQLVDCGPVLYPVGAGNEQYLRLVARKAVLESDPRTDGDGLAYNFVQTDSVALVIREGVETLIGAAVVPAAVAGDITLAVVRRYDGQVSIQAGDIAITLRDELDNYVRVSDGSAAATPNKWAIRNAAGELVGNITGNAPTATNATTANVATNADKLDEKQGADFSLKPVSMSAIHTTGVNTASTSYVEIVELAISLVLVNPALVLIIFNCNGNVSENGRSIDIMLQVNGIDKNEARGTSAYADATCNITNIALESLSAGIHSIKAFWKVTAGTGTINTKQMHVVAFPSL
jgi:hypothetical protein